MSTTITKEITIDDIFAKFPHKAQRLAQVLTNSGLACVGCNAATYETLEAGILKHGMTTNQLNQLMADLNQVLLEEDPDPDTIALTSRAAKKYLSILAEESKQGWGLRFCEKAGGCNGFEYALDYSEKAQYKDIVFESQGIEIHVPETLLSRLMGSEIDYLDGLHGSGFKITNPNVRSSCGCGTSHGY